MEQKFYALSFGFAALIFAVQQAHAEGPVCGDRAQILDQLAGRYQESRRGIGIASNNSVLEIFAAETGSWTILVTLPSGQSCLVASGQNYEPLSDPLPTAGKGA